ncbi:MAG: tryptophan synthase subunit alpha [Saprospiraceae bacterium]|nr:tryptophan synthase subunit alpha [Saprospiraceae bacterium]
MANLADRATIQASSQVALLANGMRLDLLSNRSLRQVFFNDLPFVLMGYFNRVIQYGEKKVIQKAGNCGVDAMILPDCQ